MTDWKTGILVIKYLSNGDDVVYRKSLYIVFPRLYCSGNTRGSTARHFQAEKAGLMTQKVSVEYRLFQLY